MWRYLLYDLLGVDAALAFIDSPYFLVLPLFFLAVGIVGCKTHPWSASLMLISSALMLYSHCTVPTGPMP